MLDPFQRFFYQEESPDFETCSPTMQQHACMAFKLTNEAPKALGNECATSIGVSKSSIRGIHFFHKLEGFSEIRGP